MATLIEKYMKIYINYRTVIPKLYSKFMEDSENIIKMHHRPLTNIQNLKPSHSHSLQPKQLPQNIYAFSAYQTFNIVQNGIKQFSNNECTQKQWSNYLFYVKILLFGISSLQFSILFGLLIAELISSIFSIYQFALAGFFHLLIHIALWIMIWIGTRGHLTIQKREMQEMFSKNNGSINENKRSAIATQQKIGQFYHQRGEVKTKKIQAMELQSKIDYVPQSTLKKVQIAPKIAAKDNKNQTESIHIVPKYCAVIKISQTLVTISLSIICIIISNPSNEPSNKTILILSTFSLLTQILSSISFILCISKLSLQKRAQIINENQLNPLSKQNEYQIQYVQNHTVTSIDNAFQQKKDEIVVKREEQEEKKVEVKSRDEQKQMENSQTPKSRNIQTPKSICQVEKCEKNQLKKSVLKSSKNNMAKSMHKTPTSFEDEFDNIASRRKVQINEKKIQYFEYTRQSGSITNSYEQHPPKGKSKYNEQKMKILQKKLEIQAAIIKKKVQDRRVVSASARSQKKTLENKKDGAFHQNEYFC